MTKRHVWLTAFAASSVLLVHFGSSFVGYLVNVSLIAMIAAIGLNVLMGTAGQVSIGTAAFLAIGAFGSGALLSIGVPFPADIVGSLIFAAFAGLVFGLPALRIRGLYLLLGTLAAHYVVLYGAHRYQSTVAGPAGIVLNPVFPRQYRLLAWTLVNLGALTVVLVLVRQLVRGRIGRALRLIRDREAAAPSLGVNVGRYKLLIFVLSSLIISFAGGLQAHFFGVISVDNYGLLLAVAYIAMIVIGGLDSIAGAMFGAAFVILLPHITPPIVDLVAGDSTLAATQGAHMSEVVYGLLVVIFIVKWPGGIVQLLRNLKASRFFARARRAVVHSANDRPESGAS